MSAHKCKACSGKVGVWGLGEVQADPTLMKNNDPATGSAAGTWLQLPACVYRVSSVTECCLSPGHAHPKITHIQRHDIKTQPCVLHCPLQSTVGQLLFSVSSVPFLSLLQLKDILYANGIWVPFGPYTELGAVVVNIIAMLWRVSFVHYHYMAIDPNMVLTSAWYATGSCSARDLGFNKTVFANYHGQDCVVN